MAGMDLQARLTLTFEEAVRGVTKSVRLTSDALSSPMEVNVRIPAGVADGQRIRVPGKGAPSTDGGDPGELNAAIEKVARYINIYHGAGKQKAKVELAVVLHGDATLAALNDDVYAAEFDVQGNPNLDCLHQLHEQGVPIYVCGQTLIATGHQPEDVAVFIDTAVSALTAVVNLQADGYAYVPLAK